MGCGAAIASEHYLYITTQHRGSRPRPVRGAGNTIPLTSARILTLRRTASRPCEGPLWSQGGAVALYQGRTR